MERPRAGTLTLIEATRVLRDRGWYEVNSDTLRDWESKKRLLTFQRIYSKRIPQWNQRSVTWAQVDVLEQICLLRKLGYSIDEIRDFFELKSDEVKRKVIEGAIARANSLIGRLARAEDILLSRAPGDPAGIK